MLDHLTARQFTGDELNDAFDQGMRRGLEDGKRIGWRKARTLHTAVDAASLVLAFVMGVTATMIIGGY